MNEQIEKWLEQYARFSADSLGPGAGWAVFCQGEKPLARTSDILGTQRVRKRLSFLIRRVSPLPAAAELEAFARWAEQNAPRLGDGQTVWVENAHLAAKGHDGMGRYECKLIFEFTT